MKPLDVLSNFFPITGTAEAEGNILDVAFVPLDEHLTIINPPYASPRLLVGKKGSGKSAFVSVFKNQMLALGLPVLLLKPEDIDLSGFSNDDAIGEMVRKAQASLYWAIGCKIGSQLKGFITKEDEAQLSVFAHHSGMTDKDLVRKLHTVLSAVGKGVTSIDFAGMTNALQGVGSEQLKNAIFKNAGRSGKVFFVLLDDTDQISSPTDRSHLNRIWAFLLAARSILQKCDSIRFLITLRWEIWTRLQRDDAGQRDQVDHFRGLVYHLNPTEEHVEAVFLRRLELAKSDLVRANKIAALDRTTDAFRPFFDGTGVTIPRTDKSTGWCDLVVKRSRARPRDAIQLVALLTQSAQKQKREKITQADVGPCLKQYSEERVDDLQREADVECPQIKEIIRSFARIKFEEGSFKGRADQIQAHLLKLPSLFGIQLLGRTLHADKREDALRLWKYLFDAGFFGARLDNPDQPRGFCHTVVFDDIDLVSKERWNDMQKYVWEINPAYRDFLISQSLNLRR